MLGGLLLLLLLFFLLLLLFLFRLFLKVLFFFLNWEDLCLEKKKEGSLGKVSRVFCYPKNNHAQNKHKRTQRKEGLFFTNRKDKASSFALQR